MTDPDPKSHDGSHQQYDATCDANVMVAMRDGVRLATDIYYPALDGKPVEGRFPVILERTPYDKASPSAVTNARYFARRGYVCVVQDVRGRFKSEGEWYAFAREAPDGYDTVEWVAAQPWSDGKVGTMGGSYAGSDQSALATLNPPHLATMIVAVGASNYHHSSMRQNGALEQRFLIYAFRMAVTSKEAAADPALKAALMKAFVDDIDETVDAFPLKEGATVLSRLPFYERWAIDIQTIGDYGEYWKQRGYAISEYYDQHADVPTLYLGGWYDSYARNTCESYIALSKAKSSPQRLLMGPWTHGAFEVTYSGDLDFGTDSHLHYNDMRLAWFDHYLKGMHTRVADWSPVRIFVMGTGDGKRKILGAPAARSAFPGGANHGGQWRDEPDWPLPDTSFTPYFLRAGGTLSKTEPDGDDAQPSRYTFEPRDPVPTMGGGISAATPIMEPGGFDQRGSPEFFGCKDTLPLNSRGDVLTFETPPLEEDVEVTGPVEMHLWASSSAEDTDFTAKLIDVYPASAEYSEGMAFNITDSIIRARYRNGWETPELMTPGQPYEFVFELYPTSNVFQKGHRIRLDVSSSNWPRFDVNPNTGGPLGVKGEYRAAFQAIYHDAERPSHVVLPVQSGLITDRRPPL